MIELPAPDGADVPFSGSAHAVGRHHTYTIHILTRTAFTFEEHTHDED